MPYKNAVRIYRLFLRKLLPLKGSTTDYYSTLAKSIKSELPPELCSVFPCPRMLHWNSKADTRSSGGSIQCHSGWQMIDRKALASGPNLFGVVPPDYESFGFWNTFEGSWMASPATHNSEKSESHNVILRTPSSVEIPVFWVAPTPDWVKWKYIYFLTLGRGAWH